MVNKKVVSAHVAFEKVEVIFDFIIGIRISRKHLYRVLKAYELICDLSNKRNSFEDKFKKKNSNDNEM